MPDQYPGNHSPGQRAQQQLRDLGHAVRQTARALDTSYPNAAESSRILRQYEQRGAQTLQPPPAPQPQKYLWEAPQKKRSFFPWRRKKEEIPPFRCGGVRWG
jgi:hypothetical protein